MIKRNNLVYNVDSVNEYVGDKKINQPILVAVKDVTLISDYKLKIFYNNGVTKNIELVNNSIKKFEYVSEGNKIIIETNNNEKFEVEIPMVISHKDLTNKNQEADNQHIDTTITKETLVNGDKVAILDSVTGKIVLTDKSNVGFHTHENKEYLDNYNPALFATALQGEKADSALQSLPPGTIVDVDYPALKDKVNGIEPNANNYTHPDNHPASMIVESTTKNFVTDTEKADWNAKETTDGAQTKATNALTDATAYVDTKVKTDVPENAKFTDTTYDVATTDANGLMSSTDKSKLDGIESNANNYSLPNASSTVLGGIKVGSQLTITNGVLSADIQSDNNFNSTYKTKLDDIESNANNYTHPVKHPTSILEGVNAETGSTGKYLNEQGGMAQVEGGQVKYTPSPSVVSENVQDAITELGNDKQETLVSGTNIKTINNESILGSGNIEIQGGSTDIISTNATNNTGTIVIDTTPNWQRVNISSGGNTLFLDYASGVLPNKNREYLLIINNATASTITLTLPTASFEKGGITYYFINSEVSVPIEAGKSIEVNVIFIFTSITTCNVRTLISQF